MQISLQAVHLQARTISLYTLNYFTARGTKTRLITYMKTVKNAVASIYIFSLWFVTRQICSNHWLHHNSLKK